MPDRPRPFDAERVENGDRVGDVRLHRVRRVAGRRRSPALGVADRREQAVELARTALQVVGNSRAPVQQQRRRPATSATVTVQQPTSDRGGERLLVHQTGPSCRNGRYEASSTEAIVGSASRTHRIRSSAEFCRAIVHESKAESRENDSRAVTIARRATGNGSAPTGSASVSGCTSYVPPSVPSVTTSEVSRSNSPFGAAGASTQPRVRPASQAGAGVALTSLAGVSGYDW